MLNRIFVEPLTSGSLWYPDVEGPAELLGTTLWLLGISVILCWFLSRFLFSVFLSDEGTEATIGIEAAIRIAWAIAFGAAGTVVGLYASALAGVIGVRESGWFALLILFPHAVVALALFLFSYLALRAVYGRVSA